MASGAIVSTVYISESRSSAALQSLVSHSSRRLSRITQHHHVSCAQAKHVAHPSAQLLSYFVDAAYERSSYCIGGSATAVETAIVSVANDALDRVSMLSHGGTHPTLGAVDHVSVNPVGETTLAEAAHVARSVATHLSERVPVMLYGAAREDGRSLAETRRLTRSYFSHDRAQVGSLGGIELDLGPKRVDPSLGLCCCGATTHVLNYNIQLHAGATRDQAKAIAASIRSRGGRCSVSEEDRLVGVEALALQHADGIFEVACNLLDVTKSPPDVVLARATSSAARLGVRVERDYIIGLTMDQIRAALINGEAIEPTISAPP